MYLLSSFIGYYRYRREKTRRYKAIEKEIQKIDVKVIKKHEDGLAQKLTEMNIFDSETFFEKCYKGKWFTGKFWKWLYGDLRNQRILNFLKDEKPITVLDAGCGDGCFSFLVSRYSKITVAIDISRNHLCNTKNRFRNAKACQKFDGVVAECHNLPFRYGTFDLVTCLDVLEHLNDPNRGLKELTRVLRKSGKIIVTTPCATGWKKAPNFFVLLERIFALKFPQVLNPRPKADDHGNVGLCVKDAPFFIHLDFTPNETKQLCADAGLQPEKIITYENPPIILFVSVIFRLGWFSTKKIGKLALFLEKIVSHVPLFKYVGHELMVAASRAHLS